MASVPPPRSKKTPVGMRSERTAPKYERSASSCSERTLNLNLEVSSARWRNSLLLAASLTALVATGRTYLGDSKSTISLNILRTRRVLSIGGTVRKPVSSSSSPSFTFASSCETILKLVLPFTW